jgi:hypothetical protein
VLQDLDELILKCRDERARAYIREAVTCCKAGAYRSAIVSTWIAVAFDIIDKIHELSLAGDKEAESFVVAYEASLANNNIEQSLKIERELLKTARQKFELISAQEFTDLDRLQEDRHRCAHPSRMTFSDVFSPPAELARLHIRSAVDHLLQHEPSQGKAALDALLKQIWSNYFPANADKALKLLQGSSLKRARPTLVRNLLVVLLKASLNPTTDHQQVGRNRAALRCVKAMHTEVWNQVIPTEVEKQYRNLLSDESMACGIRLLALEKDLGAALPPDQIVRFEQFIASIPDDHMYLVETALSVPQLVVTTRKTISRLTAAQMEQLALFGLAEEVRARVVNAYCKATSFDMANSWGKIVRNVCDEFTAEETREVLTAAAKNDQIRGSFEVSRVLENIRKAGNLPEGELETLITAVTAKPSAEVFDPDIPF